MAASCMKFCTLSVRIVSFLSYRHNHNILSGKKKMKRKIAGFLFVGILAVTLTGCKNTDSSKKEMEKQRAPDHAEGKLHYHPAGITY